MRIDIEDFKKKFEPMIMHNMTNGNISGSSFTVFQDDTILYSRGFGYKDLSKPSSYTSDTVSCFASNAKSFTALAILLLEEEGKLSIDDPISKYLPITVGHVNKPIKIKHLLSHSSGIPRLGHGARDINLIFPQTEHRLIPLGSWDEIFRVFNEANSEILFDPGEHFYYLNLGFTLLAGIIALVSGMSYPDFIKDRITSKIGMDRTRFLLSSYEGDDNVSLLYINDPSPEATPHPKPIDFRFDEFILGCGGIFSTTREMAKYLMMMMNDGKVDEKQIFSKNIIDELITERIKVNMTQFCYLMNGDIKYGYGWMRVDNFLGDTLIFHGGGGLGCHSQMAYLKNAKIGITSSMNFGSMPNIETISAFCYLLDKNPEDEFPYFKRNKFLTKLVGNYSSFYDIQRMKVGVNGVSLFFENPKTKKRTILIPQSDSPEELNFFIPGPSGNDEITFIIDNDNKVHYTEERFLFHRRN